MQKSVPDPRQFKDLPLLESIKLQIRADNYLVYYCLTAFLVIVLLAFWQDGTISPRVVGAINLVLIPFALILNILATKYILIRLKNAKINVIKLFGLSSTQRLIRGDSIYWAFAMLLSGLIKKNLGETPAKIFLGIGFLLSFTLGTGLMLSAILWFSITDLLQLF